MALLAGAAQPGLLSALPGRAGKGFELYAWVQKRPREEGSSSCSGATVCMHAIIAVTSSSKRTSSRRDWRPAAESQASNDLNKTPASSRQAPLAADGRERDEWSSRNGARVKNAQSSTPPPALGSSSDQQVCLPKGDKSAQLWGLASARARIQQLEAGDESG